MRYPLVLVHLLSLPFLAEAQLAGAATDTSALKPFETAVKDRGKKSDHPGQETPSAVSTTITLTPSTLSSTPSSSPSLSSTFSSQSESFGTTTTTIDVSSFTASSLSTSPPSNTAAASVLTATNNSMDSSISPTSSASSSSSSSSSHGTDEHRILIIVLSSVLGFVGLLLIAAALFLMYRFSQGRTPFGRRSATPLDDDEIESWRGTVIEQKQQPPAIDPTMLNRPRTSIQLTSSPGWTWTASPTSLHSAISPSTTVPDTPAFLAKAPNSRAGLTDETVPGAEPFIPPIKRQSSRLSKAPPGHNRSKSRRSSISAKSVWSYNGGTGSNHDSRNNERLPMWFDPDDHAIRLELSRTDMTTNSSPGTSIFDGLSGGLAPRPKSRARPWEDMEIGRAIA